MKRNCVVDAWQKNESELRGFLTRKLSNPALAEDLLQDAFLKAIALGAGFCTLDNARAWLFQVTRNLLVDHYRKQRVTEDVDERLGSAEEEIPALETLAECLPHALQTLSRKDREAIELCDLEGMRQLDYATRMGLSLAGAKSRLQRARIRLKQSIQSHCRVRYDEQGVVCCHSGPNEASNRETIDA